MKDISIAGHKIGENHRPFIIAEMSGNHNQSLETALDIVDAAADAGAHAIKLQTYTADTMTIPHDQGLFRITDPDSLWSGKTLYELYEIAHTPWEWHPAIFERARSRGLIPFSSPFDDTSVDFLEELNVPVYKVASFENKDWPLLKKIASTGKPVIMSTGASTLAEVSESVEVLKKHGCNDLVILHCTSTYPASPKNSNLRTIPLLAEIFQCHIGLSDHTLGIGVPLAAISHGVRVIEKHFTLKRKDGGVDAAFSLEPAEMAQLVQESERAFLAQGKVSLTVLSDEEASKNYQRSIYVTKDIAKGEAFTNENLRVIRPGDGLEPKYYDKILGSVARKQLKEGTPLSWHDLL